MLELCPIKKHNQELAKKTKEILSELGYEISLGHAYEFISKLDGFRNWATASASEKMLLTSLQQRGLNQINI
ncbi:MAG: hypothetical protein HQK50_03910 [Oligoflexia bacterium]|nr:hypothetical protein [Oligoflexia bacterium]